MNAIRSTEFRPHTMKTAVTRFRAAAGLRLPRRLAAVLLVTAVPLSALGAPPSQAVANHPAPQASSIASTISAAGGPHVPNPSNYTFAQVSAGTGFACALKAGGSIICWGDDSYGQTEAPAGTFTQVSAGGGVACALKGSGAIFCWGTTGMARSRCLTAASRRSAWGLSTLAD